MNRRLIAAVFALLLVIVSRTVAAPALPPFFTVPQGAEAEMGRAVEELYGEAKIPLTGADSDIRRGHHWAFRLRFTTIDAEKSPNSGQAEAYARLRTALTTSGWVLRKYFDENPPSATFQLQRGAINAWLYCQIFSSDQIEVEVIDLKPFTPTFVLTPPASNVEVVQETESFPYLKSIGDGRLGATDADNGPLWIQLKGQDEKTMVSPGSVMKRYSEIEAISNLQFILEYRSAFTKAGWEVISESQGLNQGDAVIEAHYAKNGRDIWARLHFGGSELSISVGDRSIDLIAALNKDCRVPMYGITFDFNKATIRPEAESTLQAVVAALQRDATFNIEVEGHTDNVGGDASNLTLSQARADAVKNWFVAHGIAAARLSSKGYGRTQPIAPNDSDEGRAKNRRVTLKKAGC